MTSDVEPRLDADDLARWALLGDPYLTVPVALRDLHKRIQRAILLSRKQDMEIRRDQDIREMSNQ